MTPRNSFSSFSHSFYFFLTLWSSWTRRWKHVAAVQQLSDRDSDWLIMYHLSTMLVFICMESIFHVIVLYSWKWNELIAIEADDNWTHQPCQAPWTQIVFRYFCYYSNWGTLGHIWLSFAIVARAWNFLSSIWYDIADVQLHNIQKVLKAGENSRLPLIKGL